MTQQEWTNRAPARQSDDQAIDLESLVHEVWRQRWLVVGMVVFGGIVGLGLSLWGTHYVSRGLLLVPESTVADYKRWADAMLSKPHLEKFLESSGKQNSQVASLLREVVRDAGQLGQAVHPEFSFTDRDAKLFGVQVKDAGELVGIELSLRHKEVQEEAPVLLLADYLRDTAIRVDLEAIVLKGCLENDKKKQLLRNEQLEAEFVVSQLEERAADLRNIVSRHPVATEGVRQIVSIENGGDRFLPPATQLATTEIAIADRRIEALKRERDLIAADLRRGYYCEARNMLREGTSGRDLLRSLGGILAQATSGKDMSVNVIEQTAGTLALEAREWSDRYLEQMRFVASPQGAQGQERRLGRLVGLVLGTIFGAGLGILVAVALGWWRQHRDGILVDAQ